MNIFNSNYNAGSSTYFKSEGASKRRLLNGSSNSFTRPTRDRDMYEEDINIDAGAQVIGVFGIVDRYGKQILSGWKRSNSRTDDVTTKEKVKGWSGYGADLHNAMFKGW